MYYTTHILNLREAPENGKIITEIPTDTKVIGGEPLGGWVKVKYGNQTGYVSFEFLTTTAPNEPGDPEPQFKVGDTNKDGKLTIGDLRIIHQHLTGQKLMTKEQQSLADLDGNNKVTIGDLRIIHQHLTGKELIKGW